MIIYSQSNNFNPRFSHRAARTGCPRLVRTEVPTLVGGELSEANYGEAVAGMRSLACEAGEGRPRTCQPWCTFFGSFFLHPKKEQVDNKIFYFILKL